MAFHPHTHYVVPAGGLSPDGDRWVHCPARYLLPVEILSEVFRGKFVDFLEKAWRQRKLELDGPLEQLCHPVLFEDLIDRLYRHNWVVYAKEPFAGPSADSRRRSARGPASSVASSNKSSRTKCQQISTPPGQPRWMAPRKGTAKGACGIRTSSR